MAGTRAVEGGPDASAWTVAHEFFFEHGGAERVAAELAAAVPGRPVLHLGGRPDVLAAAGLAARARPALPPWLVRQSTYHALTPLYPWLVRRTPAVTGNLLVSGYAFAPALRCTGRRVVYCHSPLRQIWSGFDEYLVRLPRHQAAALHRFVGPLRRKDLQAYAEVDEVLVPSTAVAARVRDVYGRTARVVPPPYDDAVFSPDGTARDPKRLVTTARLVDASKNVSFLLRVLARTPELRLDVIGSGRDAEALLRAAPPNVTFVGEQRPQEVAERLRGAAAYVQASTEDFGIATAEALACGTPVVALARAGALDLVQDGVNGRLYDVLDEVSVASLVREVVSRTWSADSVAATVARLRPARFRSAVREVLAEVERRPG